MKLTIEKINEYYKKIQLITTTIAIYLFTTLLKSNYFLLYNVNLKKLTNTEQIIANTTYEIFAILLALTFFIKHRKNTYDKLKDYTKLLIISISTITIYELKSFIEIIILFINKVNIKNMTPTAKTIYLILCEIMIISIIALINNEKLKKDFLNFKKKWKEYFEKYLIYYIISLMVMIISNIFISKLTGSIAGNEQGIRNTLNKLPIYMVFSAVITAPFTEEMVFRQSIKNIIQNKTIFILASGLIFGGLHVIGNINTIYDLLYLIPYCAPGFAFAYILSESDNIFVPMSIHFMHNLLLIIPQIILLFTK